MLYVPILINLLLDRLDGLSEKSEQRRLHHQVLGYILKLAPKYKEEFKQIVTKVPSLKSKLEQSLRVQDCIQTNQGKGISRESQVSRTFTPSIKLKTDFSNYSRNS